MTNCELGAMLRKNLTVTLRWDGSDLVVDLEWYDEEKRGYVLIARDNISLPTEGKKP